MGGKYFAVVAAGTWDGTVIVLSITTTTYPAMEEAR